MATSRRAGRAPWGSGGGERQWRAGAGASTCAGSGGMSAAPHIRKMFAQMQTAADNKVCADCSSRSPQWASTTYGTYICLECSGVHRSLGVHLSFVQSVTMDSWKNARFVAKMKNGGNDKVCPHHESGCFAYAQAALGCCCR